MTSGDTKACPYCAEAILTAAVKCKHCGEFLESPDHAVPTGPRITEHNCPTCSATLETARSLYVHRVNKHGYRETMSGTGPSPTQPRAGSAKQPYSGKIGGRERVSKVGDRTGDSRELKCPNCGGTNFKAKRSIKGKLGMAAAGVTVVGGPLVAALAPKTQVKCVTCGTMFKRG